MRSLAALSHTPNSIPFVVSPSDARLNVCFTCRDTETYYLRNAGAGVTPRHAYDKCC